MITSTRPPFVNAWPHHLYLAPTFRQANAQTDRSLLSITRKSSHHRRISSPPHSDPHFPFVIGRFDALSAKRLVRRVPKRDGCRLTDATSGRGSSGRRPGGRGCFCLFPGVSLGCIGRTGGRTGGRKGLIGVEAAGWIGAGGGSREVRRATGPCDVLSLLTKNLPPPVGCSFYARKRDGQLSRAYGPRLRSGSKSRPQRHPSTPMVVYAVGILLD